MIEYGKALSKGLNFSVKPKRWLQLFIVHGIFLSITLALFLPTLPTLFSYMANPTIAALSVFPVALLYMVSVVILWVLAGFWITGAIIQQSYKEKDGMLNTYKYSCRRYPHMILSTIIVTITVILVSLIPYLGSIASNVLGLIFFFVLQGIIVSKLNFWDTIANSWDIFENNLRVFKTSFKDKFFTIWFILVLITTIGYVIVSTLSPTLALELFIIWITSVVSISLIVYSRIAIIQLLIYIVSMALLLIFTLPALFVFFGLIAASVGLMLLTGATPSALNTLPALLETLTSNMTILIITGAVALVGVSIAQVFSLKAQTEFYLQLMKKK